jgi:signal peptidase I
VRSRQAGAGPEAGPTASPDDAKGPAAEEAASGSAEVLPRVRLVRGPPRRKPPARRNRGARFLRELVILVVIALVIAVVIKTYAIQAFFIPSGSMENTLEINDRVLVNKIVYDTRSIHRGDIVVFNGDGSWDPGVTAGELEFRPRSSLAALPACSVSGIRATSSSNASSGCPATTVACCDAQGRVTVNGVPLNEQSYLYPGDAPSEPGSTSSCRRAGCG